MTDYIKREDALKELLGCVPTDVHEIEDLDVIRVMLALPSADVAPVVRCKDCKCWTEWDTGTGSCSRFALDWIGTDADDFCSMGERKDDDSKGD